jgi:hypothetical protein
MRDNPMTSICWRREIDVPSGAMSSIIESLSELSHRDRPRSPGQALDGTTIDYTATIEVFDVIGTARALVVWTATFSVPDRRMATAETLGHAVFHDFVEQMRHEVLAGAHPGVRS